MARQLKGSTSLISVDIQADARAVRRRLRHIEGGADKAIARALNKTIANVFTVARRNVAKDLRLKQKDVKRAMLINRATYRHQRADIEVTGRRLPLIVFAARQKKTGVSYKAWKGGRKTVPGAFVATMASGHTGVFVRRGRRRLPIRELYGASIPHVFLRHHIERALRERAAERWPAHVDNQVRFLLSRRRG